VQSCAPSAYSTLATVTVNNPPVAGVLSADDVVCAGSNSGTLTLTGEQGSIVRWEYSVNSGSTWSPITNTSGSHVYTNLTATTQYRVLIESSPCTPVYSNVVTITVDQVSDGGITTGGSTVCVTGNNGSIQLTQFTGQVLSWESSTDGIAWTGILNTGTSQSYTNLTDTTFYRVIVKNGVCNADTSTIASVNVSQISQGGTVTGVDTACFGDEVTLYLNGYNGSVFNWITSNDNVTWSGVVNSVDSITFSLVQDVYYAAIVSNGACPPAQSSIKKVVSSIVIASASNDTTITSGASVNLVASGGSNYSWTPSAGLSSSTISNPVATPTETTSYTVIVSNSLGCMDTADVIITVKDVVDTVNTAIKIPNLITPNGDGYNDEWKLEGVDLSTSSLIIFDAYGVVVFLANPYTNNWNAEWKGKPLPDGTYYYILDAIGIPTEKGLKGNITVIRGQ
jgi:gliding motility-associated-like protein